MKTFFLLLTAFFSASGIPVQNQQKGSLPDVSSAEQGAARLLDAIQTKDSSKAADFFFPKEAFDLVKDLPKPERYHRKLVKWYEEDIVKEHPRFRAGDWRFESVELGRCRWKAVGAEQNKAAYWSCSRNFVTAVSGTKKRRFEIRVLINWGDRWYVTHLGPIR